MIDAKRRKGKRGDGEGSIRWSEKKKLWIARLMVGYRPDGKPDIREVSAKLRGECQRKLDELRQRASGGLLADAGKDRETLKGFLTGWLEAVKGTVRASTHDGYRIYVEKHLIPGLGRPKLAALKPDDIRRFYRAKAEAGCRRGQCTTATRSCTRPCTTPCCGTTSRSTPVIG